MQQKSMKQTKHALEYVWKQRKSRKDETIQFCTNKNDKDISKQSLEHQKSKT